LNIYSNPTILLAGTGSLTSELTNSFRKSSRFQVSFLDSDRISDLEFFLSQLKEVPQVILLASFNSIVPTHLLSESSLWLNLHAGILPNYRGFNANAWAILRNEAYIGYTLHQVIESFDSGAIFFCHKEPIHPTQTYAEARPALLKHMIENTPNVVGRILDGTLQPQAQDENKSFVCKRISAEFGYIRYWSKKSQDIYNLYRVMAAPLGSGIYTNFKSFRLDIERLQLVEEVIHSNAQAGTIIEVKKDNSVLVRTIDGALRITQMKFNTQTNLVSGYLELGSQLGE